MCFVDAVSPTPGSCFYLGPVMYCMERSRCCACVLHISAQQPVDYAEGGEGGPRRPPPCILERKLGAAFAIECRNSELVRALSLHHPAVALSAGCMMMSHVCRRGPISTGTCGTCGIGDYDLSTRHGMEHTLLDCVVEATEMHACIGGNGRRM